MTASTIRHAGRNETIVLMKKLHGAGITSDVAYVTGLASIGLSIAMFTSGKKRLDNGQRERSAIFVGLWAPTFFVIGSAMTTLES